MVRIADEMGLGKTIQIISFLSALEKSDPVLIIVPLCILNNWKEEWLKFAPQLTRDYDNGLYCLHGNRQERSEQVSNIKNNCPRVILTTFETCNQVIDFLQKIKFSVLVIDEAHRIKNESSLIYENLSSLDSKQRVLLTGTPIQNDLKELYSLLKFANPNLFPFGSSEFQDWYLNDIDGLKKVLDLCMLRRQKEQVIKLPPIKETVVYTKMTELQIKLYKGILSKNVQTVLNNRVGLLNILMQLRKCINHPYLFNGVEPEPFVAGDHLITTSGKMTVLNQILEYLKEKRKKVLVFSQMTHMLDIVQDYLNWKEYNYERLDGSVRSEERNLAIKKFQQDEDVFVFLLSTRAGGVGLNLTAANVVILLDSDFNPMQDQQAAARVHRIGQTAEVHVIRFVTANTAEELIWKRASRKLLLSKKVMEKQDHKEEEDQDLISIVRFGLAKMNLPNNEPPSLSQEQIDDIFKDQVAEQVQVDSIVKTEQDSMYIYEGKDYKADQDALDNLVSLKRPASDEEMDDRSQRLQEQRIAHAKRQRDLKKQRWSERGYTSRTVESIKEQMGQEALQVRIKAESDQEMLFFTQGSALDPQDYQGMPRIICHLVDDSGRWPAKGVFRAIDAKYPDIKLIYADLVDMRDADMGSCHVLSVGDNTFVCLLVAQKFKHSQPTSPVNFTHLESSLVDLAWFASLVKGSVHLPRIGQGTAGFDWYQTERLIRKTLTGIPTFM